MGIKSILQFDHYQVNKFTLKVTGLPTLTPIKVGAIEEELDNVDLPDRTTHTGGRAKPVEFDIEIPLHHKAEIVAMDGWFNEGRDPVSLFHKKSAILIIDTQSGLTKKSFSLFGCFPQKRSLPELDLDNDGEMATVTYTMKADEVLSI